MQCSIVAVKFIRSENMVVIQCGCGKTHYYQIKSGVQSDS